MPKRYFLRLAYDGTPFHGWQIQPNAKSIQESLNEAFSTILRQKVYTVGCGRTDTGVHARQFYAHFETEKPIDDLEEINYKANQILPKEIAIYEIFPVAQDIHARFSATSRTYEYLITSRKDPFAANRMYEFRQALDLKKMNEACQVLFEFEDFESFSRTGSQTEHHLCQMMCAEWREGEHYLQFKVQANRFLRNMVRALVGTLMDVGLEKMTVEEFRNVIKAKDRSQASSSAPAHGLYLVNIDYPKGFRNL